MVGFLLVVLACTLWAVDTLIRYPLTTAGIPAVSLVFIEHTILTAIFSVIFFKSLRKIWEAKAAHFFYFFMIGGVGSALATVAFTRAFVFLNPSLVIVLQKFQPLVVIVLARFVLKETINKYFLFWAAIAILGAFFISFDDILKLANSGQSLKELLFSPGAFQGYVLVAFSNLGWGAATVFGKKLGVEGYSNEQIMSGRFIMGFLCLLPFASMEKVFWDFSLNTYGKIALMVFLSGLLAMYIYYQGLRKISARLCSLAEMFFPFMAVIVNWLFLHTTLTPVQLIGGGLLVVASVIIQLKHY